MRSRRGLPAVSEAHVLCVSQSLCSGSVVGIKSESSGPPGTGHSEGARPTWTGTPKESSPLRWRLQGRHWVAPFVFSTCAALGKESIRVMAGTCSVCRAGQWGRVTAKNLQAGRVTRSPGAAGVSFSGGARCPIEVVRSTSHPLSDQAAGSLPRLGAQ